MSAWLSQLSDRLDFGVVLRNVDGSLRMVNQRAAELLERDEERFEAEWPEFAAALEAQAGPEVWSEEGAFEVMLPTGAEERRFRVEVLPVEDEECLGQLLVLRDQRQLTAAEQDIWLASQMRSLSRLYRSMAHDLRAPLNSMVIHLELLSDAVASVAGASANGGRTSRYVRVLKEEMERLNRLLLSFLTQSAPASESVRVYDLAALAADVATFVEPQAAKQETEVAVEAGGDDGPVEAWGNADHVRQALLSLVVNALEAVAGRPAGRIEIGVGRDGDDVFVAVADNGPGVDEEFGERIFEMHFTSKETGSGIGLAVARAIAERQGGSLTAGRGPGGGARFVLTLPAAAPAAEEN